MNSCFLALLLAGATAGLVAPLSRAEQAAAPVTPKVDVVTGSEKNFGDSPVIIVPTIFLQLPLLGKVAVSQQGSALRAVGGGSTNTVKASARYSVSGLDKAMAQGLAKKVYDDFVGKLRAAGYTVKTYDDIKDLDVVKKAERQKPVAALGLPLDKDMGGSNVFLIATPSDDQAFVSGLSGGVFNQFMSLGKSKLGEGTVLMPTYVIACPQVWGEKASGYSTISAGINVAAGMNLQSAYVPLLTQKGSWGDIKTKHPVINVATKTGDIAKQDTTSGAANTFSHAMSLISGAGQINSKSAIYTFVIDPEAYTAGVMAGTGMFNDTAAKIIAAQKK